MRFSCASVRSNGDGKESRNISLETAREFKQYNLHTGDNEVGL